MGTQQELGQMKCKKGYKKHLFSNRVVDMWRKRNEQEVNAACMGNLYVCKLEI